MLHSRVRLRFVFAEPAQCFVIGQCHGNTALFDIGVGTTCASNVMHKVPIVSVKRGVWSGGH